mgnify:CR=1 FL=1
MTALFEGLTHWHWLGLGFVLLAIEVMGSMGFLLWTGIAALEVGILLLIWPFGSPLAWNHALRVTVDGEGLCDVDGLDARASRYRCTAAITLEPLSNDIAVNGSFS